MRASHPCVFIVLLKFATTALSCDRGVPAYGRECRKNGLSDAKSPFPVADGTPSTPSTPRRQDLEGRDRRSRMRIARGVNAPLSVRYPPRTSSPRGALGVLAVLALGCPRQLRSHRKDLVERLARARQQGIIPRHHLGHDRLVVADLAQRGHHVFPRHVALEQVAESGEVADGGLEVLDVYPADALTA